MKTDNVNKLIDLVPNDNTRFSIYATNSCV